jgi:hypothetical protein
MFESISNFFSNKYNSFISYLSLQDTQQKINIASITVSEGFKVLMASLLSIFIPQKCVINGVSRTCTFSDNFADLTHYNTFVVIFNFITLGVFVGLYYVEIKREDWMIKHLEFDNNYSDNNLQTLKTSYPKIFVRLTHYNKQYYKYYSILKYIFLINFIVSAVLVIHFYYLDYRTITTLLTNTILCWSKVMVGNNIAYESLTDEKAISYYNTKFVYFNNIDTDYKKNEPKVDEETNNESDKKEITEIKVNNESDKKEIKVNNESDKTEIKVDNESDKTENNETNIDIESNKL